MAVNLQTIKEIRNYLVTELGEIYSLSEAGSIANIVLKYVLRKDNLYLFSRPEESIPEKNIDKLLDISNQLKTGKPVQYIVGETGFYGFTIKVNGNVLIPRPETEELVDLVIKENPEFTGHVLDIGTGSGCIAVALAGNLPQAAVTAIDNSSLALQTASVNARINDVNIRFLDFDITSGLIPETGTAEIIVSNPPYVLNSEKLSMHKNILDFEPAAALFVSDNEPLKFYEAILDIAIELLLKGGRIYFEINESKGKSMADLLRHYNYSDIKVIKDINGKDRIIKGIKNE
jgi:release factor glutamine methyltransferase